MLDMLWASRRGTEEQEKETQKLLLHSDGFTSQWLKTTFYPVVYGLWGIVAFS